MIRYITDDLKVSSDDSYESDEEQIKSKSFFKKKCSLKLKFDSFKCYSFLRQEGGA